MTADQQPRLRNDRWRDPVQEAVNRAFQDGRFTTCWNENLRDAIVDAVTARVMQVDANRKHALKFNVSEALDKAFVRLLPEYIGNKETLNNLLSLFRRTLSDALASAVMEVVEASEDGR
jgi:hypothetical protein